MSRRKQKQRYVPKSRDIQKASSQELAVSRMRMGEMGSLALSQIQVDSDRMKAEEVRWPQLIGTVESMKQDATVAMALETKYKFIEKAFSSFKVLSSDSQESKDAAKFIEYCLKNMDGMTLRQFARSAATFNEYGFAVVEKVYTKVTAPGQYFGRYKVKKLAFRPQASLSRTKPLVYAEGANELDYVNQSMAAFTNITNVTDLARQISIAIKGDTVKIPANRVMVMRTGGSGSNGMGVSPLIGCYRAWREKVLIENLEVVGATKDLGGIIELKIPSQILNKAAMDPTSPEAEMVRGLMTDAANAHAGEQSFFLLPSDMKDGASSYSMSLKGIDGVGKQYSTKDLISERKKSILDLFGAGFMNVGNDKAGSFSLSESKQTIHTHFVQCDLEIILEALNENLIPQVLALNDIRLAEEDMPKVKAGRITDIDMEGYSKAVQRMAAVGFLAKTRETYNRILEVMDIDYQIPEDMPREEMLALFGEDVSRSGDGMAVGSSGTGTSKVSSVRDNSVSNLDN